MLTFIAFVLTILGSVNWLMIGLLQYDFIAGIFGFQASIFSRLIYIVFGISSVYLIIRIIINKGSVKIWEKRKKQSEKPQTAVANVEVAEEMPEKAEKKHKFSLKNWFKKRKEKKKHKISSEKPSELVKIEENEPKDETSSLEEESLFDEVTKNSH